MAEDSRRSLSRISENPFPEGDSEGTASGGSSSIGTVLQNTDDGSNVRKDMETRMMRREFSLDNILAELPRSASQVDLTHH